MNVQLFNTEMPYLTPVSEFRYILVGDTIPLFTVKDRATMNKKAGIVARRYDRGAVMCDDLGKLRAIMNQYGGYLYDLEEFKLIGQNLNGTLLEDWSFSGETSRDTNLFLGETESHIRVLHRVLANGTMTVVRFYQDLATVLGAKA